MRVSQDQILEKYSYRKEKPLRIEGNYSIYSGVQKETNIAVTIKILKHANLQLHKYLKKIKQTKSENVIKIFDLGLTQNNLILVSQRLTYPNLKIALTRCERLDENDSIYIVKNIMNGHIQLLKNDCNWFGTEGDIQFTDTGIKLSWNNSCNFNLVNPFPNIIQRLYDRPQNQYILPFPPNKILKELAILSKQNASQISLHPQMKKKQKLLKKKGKSWLALRETKNKNQYFDEFCYLAISQDYGFVRVKIYETGKISPNHLTFNKTKSAFTKVVDVYEQDGKTIIVSDYSNDGNLQAYVVKLKNSGIQLKQDQIQFFYFSLFQPLKNVQQSSIKSINMLHIKNIYIENGIPKIGQPVPINNKIMEVMKDRADVPDFYHPGFKKDPNSRQQSYDTYSLGVLLYKLMYTQYPIFPNGKVHIPSTPNYNKRLKISLQIFLNQGGKLSQIENRIEISQNVRKKIQQNKQKLIIGFNQHEKKEKIKIEQNQSILEHQSQSKMSQSSSSQESIDGEQKWYVHLWSLLQVEKSQPLKNKYIICDQLEKSTYRVCRLWIKIILVIMLYIFGFYYHYIANNVQLISNHNNIKEITTQIDGSQYTVITTDRNVLNILFARNQDTLENILKTNCLLNSYNENPNYSEFVYDNSSGWILFTVTALLSLFVIIIFKIVQIMIFDEIKMFYNYQNGIANFNVTNWFILNLLWLALINGHFFFFNFIFYGSTEPCLSYPLNSIYGSTKTLFENRSLYLEIYMILLIIQMIIILAHLIFVNFTIHVKYNKIVNPICIFGLFLFLEWLIIRFGAILNSQFYPSASNDPQNVSKLYFQSGDIQGIFGTIPEFFFIFELIIVLAIDMLFWCLFDRRRNQLVNKDQKSQMSIEQLA